MNFKSHHKEINPIQHELKIEFGWGEVEKCIPDILNEFKKNSNIKGFRKGKAPSSVVKAQIGETRIQEFDEMIVSESPTDEIEWDYLRGTGGKVIRKRETDGETETDTLHVNSGLGSTLTVLKPDMDSPTLDEGCYKVTADGEPFHVVDFEPPDENHIRYHGGFLEDKELHTSVADEERGFFYRMGVRHYSPMLGRFLQKDPFTIGRAPNKSNPLNVNPYIYAHNKPLHLSDTSGYTPGGWDIMPAPCPDCDGWFGKGHGSGGAIGGLIGYSLKANDDILSKRGIGSFGNEEIECDVWSPEECIDDERYPDTCVNRCCRLNTEPEWTGCCNSFELPFSNVCNTTAEGACGCACCWVSGPENAPSALPAQQPNGGNGTFTLGPPRIGPDGKGGNTWSGGHGLHPAPTPIRPDRIPNLMGTYSPFLPFDPIIGGLAGFLNWYYGLTGIATIAGVLGCGWVTGTKAKEIAEMALENPDECKFWYCMCDACNNFNKWAWLPTAASMVGTAIYVFLVPTGALFGTGTFWTVSNAGWLAFLVADSYMVFQNCMNR